MKIIVLRLLDDQNNASQRLISVMENRDPLLRQEEESIVSFSMTCHLFNQEIQENKLLFL